MTTRIVSAGSANSPSQRSIVAIGIDGKYESTPTGKRLKWNDYSLVDQRWNRTAGSSSQYIGAYWFDAVLPVSLINSNVILQAQSQLLENVRGHDFNLGTFAAQGGQTVSMVTSAIGAVGGAILDLKKGRFESAARRFGVAPRPSRLSQKDVAGRWLELQYGWLPLLSDVHEATKAYEVLTSSPRRTRVSAQVTKSQISEMSVSPALFSMKGNQRSSIRIIYEMTEVMDAPRSLGLTDPLTVAWELIPYSFVADWFIPIGTYLENLNQIPRLSGRFLTTIVNKGTSSSAPRPFSETGVIWTNPPICSYTFFHMNRDASTSLSVPTPTFNSLADAMSPKRIWNSLALLVQKL